MGWSAIGLCEHLPPCRTLKTVLLLQTDTALPSLQRGYSHQLSPPTLTPQPSQWHRRRERRREGGTREGRGAEGGEDDS